MRQELVLLAMLASLCVHAHPGGDLPTVFDEPPSERVKVSADPFHRNPAAAMRFLVAKRDKSARQNRFCVVGYKWPDGHINAYVHWKEEQSLIIWNGSRYPEMLEESLHFSRHHLKLGEDTVPTDEDINGSTYLVTEAWWHGVANDCQKHGEKYTIKPFKVKKATAE